MAELTVHDLIDHPEILDQVFKEHPGLAEQYPVVAEGVRLGMQLRRKTNEVEGMLDELQRLRSLAGGQGCRC